MAERHGRFPGVVVGIVTNRDDPEGQGRIELQFPWLSESQRSSWAPVAAPLAGKDRGMFFMPEIGDEALVAFEHGDFDHPFIVGFVWNGVDTPPETNLQNRVILTPGGHTLRFEDTDNAKKVILQSDSGHQIVLDDSPAGQTITVQTKGQQRIVLDDKDSSIQLQGGGRILAMRNGQVLIS
jgi:uncharacterized protein involved in type VI secretion and phage assembly